MNDRKPAPDALVAASTTSEGAPELPRRAYVAPAIRLFGRVEDLTLGTGLTSNDLNQATRRRRNPPGQGN